MWTKWYLNFKQHTYLIAASQQTSYIKTSRVFRNFKLFQPLKSAAHNVSLQQTKTYPKQLQNSIWISTCTCTLPMFRFPYRFFLVKKTSFSMCKMHTLSFTYSIANDYKRRSQPPYTITCKTILAALNLTVCLDISAQMSCTGQILNRFDLVQQQKQAY